MKENFNKFLLLIILISITITSFGATSITNSSKVYFEELEELIIKKESESKEKTDLEFGGNSPFIASDFTNTDFNTHFVVNLTSSNNSVLVTDNKEELYILFCSLKLHFC